MDGEISQVKDALTYAHELRERGIVGTVYALPQEIRNDIHQRFYDGESCRQIAKAINTKYQQKISYLLPHPISFTAINNYRNHYWRKTPAYRNLLIRGDERLLDEIEDVRQNINAYLQLLEYSKIQRDRVVAFRKIEEGLPMTLPAVRREIMLGVKIQSKIISLELELGIREKQYVYLTN